MRSRHIGASLLAMIACFLADWCLAAPPVERAILAHGPPRAGRIVGVDSHWNFEFQEGSEQRRIAAAELVCWGAVHEPTRGHLLVTNDDSQLAIADWRLRGGALEAPATASFLAREFSIGRDRLRGVVLDLPAGAPARDTWIERLRTEKADLDRLWLSEGDTVGGTILGTQRKPNGDAREPVDVVQLKSGTTQVELPLDRLRGMAFRAERRPATADGTHVLFGFRDGSFLDVQQVAVEKNTTQLTLASRVTLSADTESFWSELVFVQPIGAGVVYLSDLAPIGYKHIPFLAQPWPYGVDRNVLGGRLRHAGRLIPKGLGMHSTSRLAYDLGGRFRSLQADLALDDAADQFGSVVYRVLLDRGDGQWQSGYESPIVRGSQAAVKLEVDVSGAERVALIVDLADRGDELDHANWLNARLIP